MAGERVRTADGVRAAQRALDAGLAQNAAGRPARASASFRATLRHLGPAPDLLGSRQSRVPPSSSVPDGAYLRARALLGLVMSDFELRADGAAAAATLDTAEAWARSAGATAVEVAVQGQRGLLRLRAGDNVGALRELDRAAVRLAEAEPLDACRLLLNRGSLHLELGDLRAAREDLRACATRAQAVGNRLLQFKAEHNLGYLEYLTGDLPAALTAMADAARIDHDGSPAVALLDRAQVLTEAGLTAEADAVLAQAAELFAAQRLSHDLAQVELARSYCALLAGRPQDALRRARSARRRFARRRNVVWSGRADLAVCRAELAVLLDTDGPAAAFGRLAARTRALAERARAQGDVTGRELARAALVTAAEALVAAGRIAAAHATLAQVGRLRARDPLWLAVQLRAVRAQLAFADGRAARAREHVRAGQATLAEHRRRLGSVEAVSAAALHGDRLTAADVAAAVAGGDPRAVLDAVERGRATFAGPARVRPPDDAVLAELLAELRRCVEQERALSDSVQLTGQRTALRREAARLRLAVRERSWQLGEGVGAPSPVSAGQVGTALRRGLTSGTAVTVADYLVHRGVVHAVVVDGHGVRLQRLADVTAVEELARRLRADLHALANPLLPAPLRDVVGRSLRRSLAALDEQLVAPLGCAGALHVVAGGALVSLPWGMVPSRAGRPTSVSTRVQLGSGTPVDASGVVALAGPGLEHAEAEVEAVVGAWPQAEALVGAAAVCSAAAGALRTAGVVHLAAHGRHVADNPLFSWVRLVDGPLFAHELEGATMPGSTVVLSACEVGQVTPRPGGEVLGLASVLMRLGAGAVVAALAPLRDEVAAQVMPVLHGLLSDGVAPATALARATSGTDDPVPLSCFVPGVPGT